MDISHGHFQKSGAVLHTSSEQVSATDCDRVFRCAEKEGELESVRAAATEHSVLEHPAQHLPSMIGIFEGLYVH